MTTLDEKQIAQVEALASVLTIKQIAQYFGINERTFKRMLAAQPDVRAAYDKGKSRAIAMVAGKLLSAAKEGDRVAQIFYLKTQARWSEVQKDDDHDDWLNESDNKQRTGVLVIPSSPTTPSDWVERFSDMAQGKHADADK